MIEPTLSQLDLTDFDVLHTSNGPVKVEPSLPRTETGTPTASGAKGKRKAFFVRLFESTFQNLSSLLKGL